MPHRITGIAFRRDGVLHPEGTILDDLSDEDLKILGDRAQAVEPDAPSSKPQTGAGSGEDDKSDPGPSSGSDSGSDPDKAPEKDQKAKPPKKK